MKKRNGIQTRSWNPSLPSTGEPLDLEVEDVGTITLVYKEAWGENRLSTGHVWIGHGLAVIASIDQTHHGRLLHCSVTMRFMQNGKGYEDYPPWPVVAAVKRALYPPDVAAVMVMPEEENYINVSRRCLHIWQLPAQWGVQ
jgi:hypothetical protein